MTRSWQPILDGELAEQVTRSIHDVGDALRSRSADDSEGPNFAGGEAGIAMTCSYLGTAFPERDYRDLAEAALDRAIDAVAEQPLAAAFYGGFTGVAWVYEHLQGRLFEPSDEDLNEGIDEAIAQLLEHSPWPFDYDLISGLVGFGIYAVERAARPLARVCADRIVARLGELAVEKDGGLSWLTPPSLMIPETAAAYPEGYYNMGLAHGVPGIYAILGELIAKGLVGDEARPLLDGAVAWQLAQSRPAGDEGSRFGYYWASNKESTASRSAWCYGDPGAAAALLVAARTVGKPEWERQAVEIMLHDAQRPHDQAGVRDAGLCHGSAGLAHIYNRLFQATGEQAFRDAARYWFQHTLELRREGGVGGYWAWSMPRGQRTGSLQWMPEYGFLTGASGVALALLAAVTDIEPAWDRSLLVDIPLG